MSNCRDQLIGEEILNAITTIKGLIDYLFKDDYPEEVLVVDWEIEKICFLVRNHFGLISANLNRPQMNRG
ncbi:hypothetical protein [Desulfotruncus alcoholivorax]|uniref:hypothetical protein n=1 Tax=Desulfotruncus alcoholivorax TaxID=265477 RepID=UPI000421146C|nr:hypothetical protein [Desulfotruncus alcoholivorax]